MAYTTTKPKYTHEDLKAFWDKDLLIVKQVCLNAVAGINQGNKEITSEQMKEKMEELLKWFYPNGTAYNCGDSSCLKCNPNATPF